MGKAWAAKGGRKPAKSPAVQGFKARLCIWTEYGAYVGQGDD